MAKCRICYDTEWVCENHVDRPWSKTLPNGCECGAGAPCICSPLHYEHPSQRRARSDEAVRRNTGHDV